MAKLSDMKGQELADIKEEKSKIKFIFKDGKKYSLRVHEGKFIFSTEDEQ
jgi:hypothetical protein